MRLRANPDFKVRHVNTRRSEIWFKSKGLRPTKPAVFPQNLLKIHEVLAFVLYTNYPFARNTLGGEGSNIVPKKIIKNGKDNVLSKVLTYETDAYQFYIIVIGTGDSL